MTRHYTSREFNQDTAGAKRDARDGPVFITDRGEPAHVLLTYGEYQRLTGVGRSIGDLLSNPDVADIDFDPPKLGGLGLRPAEFD